MHWKVVISPELPTFLTFLKKTLEDGLTGLRLNTPRTIKISKRNWVCSFETISWSTKVSLRIRSSSNKPENFSQIRKIKDSTRSGWKSSPRNSRFLLAKTTTPLEDPQENDRYISTQRCLWLVNKLLKNIIIKILLSRLYNIINL